VAAVDGHAGEPSRSSRQLGFGRVAEDALAEHETVITTKPGVGAERAHPRSVRDVQQRLDECDGNPGRANAHAALGLAATFGRTATSVDDAAFLTTWAAKTAWMLS
jgi:hypothetical protein